MSKTKEREYRLTPLGWLKLELASKKPDEEIDVERLWGDLTTFVSRQAEENGMPKGGIPCLVLQDGGHCVTAEQGSMGK